MVAFLRQACRWIRRRCTRRRAAAFTQTRRRATTTAPTAGTPARSRTPRRAQTWYVSAPLVMQLQISDSHPGALAGEGVSSDRCAVPSAEPEAGLQQAGVERGERHGRLRRLTLCICALVISKCISVVAQSPPFSSTVRAAGPRCSPALPSAQHRPPPRHGCPRPRRARCGAARRPLPRSRSAR